MNIGLVMKPNRLKTKELNKVHSKLTEIRMGGVLHSTAEWEVSVENLNIVPESIIIFHF